MENKEEKQYAFLFCFSEWKHSYVKSFLPEYDVKFIPRGLKLRWIIPILKLYKNKVFIVWGYKDDEELTYISKYTDVPLYRMEDGFIRSQGLGSNFNTPLSMCLDRRGLYFDSRSTSDLEHLLNTYPFQNELELMDEAKKCMELLLDLKISKYNNVRSQDVLEIYGPKKGKRVLVLGQVEDDASIAYGSNTKISNNELVKVAKKENPEAEIIYKPHPDVLFNRRKKLSDPQEVKDIATIIETPLSLADSFVTIDHVYTITSLGGFEALMRDIPVTTFGAPFYSGWGLTDDRQVIPRRKRSLSKEEIFAGAYILYPRYIDPYNNSPMTVDQAIKKIYSSI